MTIESWVKSLSRRLSITVDVRMAVPPAALDERQWEGAPGPLTHERRRLGPGRFPSETGARWRNPWDALPAACSAPGSRRNG